MHLFDIHPPKLKVESNSSRSSCSALRLQTPHAISDVYNTERHVESGLGKRDWKIPRQELKIIPRGETQCVPRNRKSAVADTYWQDVCRQTQFVKKSVTKSANSPANCKHFGKQLSSLRSRSRKDEESNRDGEQEPKR